MNKQNVLVDFLRISESIRTGKHHRGKKHHKRDVERKSKDIDCGGKYNDCGNNGEKFHRRRMSATSENVLCLLLKEGSLNQRNIAKTMNISAQAVSEMIKKLLDNELINKENGELNNENIITLTEKGVKLANKIDKKMSVIAESIFDDFTQDDMDKFIYFIEKIRKNQENLMDKQMNSDEDME